MTTATKTTYMLQTFVKTFLHDHATWFDGHPFSDLESAQAELRNAEIFPVRIIKRTITVVDEEVG